MDRSRLILIVADDFPPRIGGISTALFNVARALGARGWGVTVATTQAGAAASECSFSVSSVPSWLRFSKAGLKLITLLLSAWRVAWHRRPSHVLVGKWTYDGLVALVLRSCFGLKYSVFAHGTELRSFGRLSLGGLLCKVVLRHASKVIANSRFTARLVQDAAGVPSGKIHVFPALVSPDDVLRHRAAAYQEVLPDVTKPYILTASRLYPRKGHDIVLRALAFLEQEFPTLHYVYTGDGPSAADLVRLAGDLGITDHVKALGTVRQEVLYALYAQCEVFVMLSREENGDVEGLGLAFAEASLFERPVIAGDTGGVREVVEEGVTGYIVRPTDVLAVANRLRDVLSDPALAARLGREGRRRVSELLDIRKRVFELEPFLG